MMNKLMKKMAVLAATGVIGLSGAAGCMMTSAVTVMANDGSEEYGSYNCVNDYPDQYTVTVEDGYLALRDDACYDDSNIIGKLYRGQQVEVIRYDADSIYWVVYSPDLNMSGYVNSDFLH